MAVKVIKKPTVNEVQAIMNNHLEKLYSFYGNSSGVKIARKHIGWYFDNLGSVPSRRKAEIYQILNPCQQRAMVNSVFLEEFL